MSSNFFLKHNCCQVIFEPHLIYWHVSISCTIYMQTNLCIHLGLTIKYFASYESSTCVLHPTPSLYSVWVCWWLWNIHCSFLLLFLFPSFLWYILSINSWLPSLAVYLNIEQCTIALLWHVTKITYFLWEFIDWNQGLKNENILIMWL